MIVLGVILPWLSDPTTSISGLSAVVSSLGMVMLIFGLLGLIMVAPGRRGLAIGSIVFGILSLLLYLGLLGISGLISSGLSGTVSVGIGLYVGFIGSIVLIVGAVMVMSSAKKTAVPVAPPAPPMAP